MNKHKILAVLKPKYDFPDFLIACDGVALIKDGKSDSVRGFDKASYQAKKHSISLGWGLTYSNDGVNMERLASLLKELVEIKEGGRK